MPEFLCKFILSMIRDCKKELCFLLAGMVLCLCLLLYNGNQIFSDRITDKEVLQYNDNRIFFAFSDADRLGQIVEQVAAMPAVYGVYLYGETDGHVKIQCGTRIPMIADNCLITGKIPKHLSEGEVITSYSLLGDDMPAAGSLDEGVAKIEEEDPVFQKEFIAQGERVWIGGREFKNVAEISDSDGNIVAADDFFAICKESGNSEIILCYVYENGFTQKQQKKIEDIVAAVKQPERIWQGIAGQGIDFSFFMEIMKYHFLGIILASLNSFFLYAYLFHKRIPVYTVLKLQGLTSLNLQGMLLIEYLLIHIAAVFTSSLLFGIYSFGSQNPLRHIGQIALYSFGSVLAADLILFFVLTWKLVRWQPFALYQRRE